MDLRHTSSYSKLWQMMRYSNLSFASIVAITTLLIVGLRWLFPERPLNYVGPRALLDAGFALSFLGVMLLLAGGGGRKIQSWLKLEGLTNLEQAIFGLRRSGLPGASPRRSLPGWIRL